MALDMKRRDLNIRIEELTRVEGHGNVVVDVSRGRVKEARFEVVESPRFFEVMLRGRRYDEAQHIMSRICGICAVSHTSASLKAIESAMGMSISRRSTLLRKLAMCGEMIQSHILHIHFLAIPDLVNAGSIIPLIKTHPEIARAGLHVKKIANDICRVVAGRHIHPISLFPGGVVHTPEKDELRNLKRHLQGLFEHLDLTVEFLLDHPFPSYTRPREFISLKMRGEYGIYNGEPFSSMGYPLNTTTYTKRIKEFVVPYSTAKKARSKAGGFMVGALARLNNNVRNLRARAKKALSRLKIKIPSYNPFMNNHAQLVECFHFTEEALCIIDTLLDMELKDEPPAKPRGYGRGIGIVEAPRGILYHEYRINRDGIIEDVNCIIPTAQNQIPIEEDLRGFVETILDRPREEVRWLIEVLVRAYDPCISCSTHMMDVTFV